MHLVIPTHISSFWVVCHPNKTFPPKKLEQESQNRLPISSHRQTIPSLTFDPWPTMPILAGYKWVVVEPCACSTPMWVHGLSATHAFAMPIGLSSLPACSTAYFLLFMAWMCLGLHSLHLVSSPSWVLLRYGPFLHQFSPCFLLLLVCGSTNTFTTSLYCFCHASC